MYTNKTESVVANQREDFSFILQKNAQKEYSNLDILSEYYRHLKMTSTPKNNLEESLNESWVEVGPGSWSNEGTNSRSTPVHFLGGGSSTPSILSSGNMEKLLWEAQRESSHSSAIGSRISSRKGSPKSPPNSPASECNEFPFLRGKGQLSSDIDRQVGTEWIWDWSSRPDQGPPKDWKFHHPMTLGKASGRLSLRNSKIVKRGLFSTEVLSVLVLTNIISLLVGAGIGVLLGKRFNNVIVTIPLD